MGGGSWSSDAYVSHSVANNYKSKSVEKIYSSQLDQALDPKGVKVREARDSPEHPHSTPIIIGLDVTGSMNPVLGYFTKDAGLNKLMTEIYKREPVKDPQIMCVAIGDMEVDEAPLQVSQFESDIRIAKQLEKIFFERGGGGNEHESYTIPWYFAAFHTVTDQFEKRGKKGYLFTIGDECPNPELPISEFERVLGYTPQGLLDNEALLKQVSEKYNVFHLMVKDGNFFQREGNKVMKQWGKLLGQRAILLPKIHLLSEVIVSTIQMNEGTAFDKVMDSWDPKTKKILESIPEFEHIVDLS